MDIHKINILTQRELQVLGLLSKGMSSKEVAAHLYISIHTVEYHRRQMLSKTGARNIVELISMAIRHGMI